MITHILDKKLAKNVANLNSIIANLDPTQRHTIKIKAFAETRSDLQNRLSHSWYGDLAENLKENDAIGYKCFCKLHFGVALMRAEDDEFREVYDAAIKALSYDNKLAIMKILPVTSLMNTKQLSSYLEQMKSYYLEHNGFDLKYPQYY